MPGQLCCVTARGAEDTAPQDKNKQLEVGALPKTLLKNMPFLIVLLLDLALMIRPIVSDVKNLRALKTVYLLKSKALY